MSVSFEQPRSYPAALLKWRHHLPNHLHVFVERSSRRDIHSSREFNYDALSKSSIEAHFHRNVTSSFISLYESEDTASRRRPHANKVGGKPRSSDAVKMAIDTSGLRAAWLSVDKGLCLPVWFETDRKESENDDDREVLWFCLEEVKVVLQVDGNIGEKGEWLACGFIPQSRVIVCRASPSPEYPTRVFDDDEKEEADRKTRRERRRVDSQRLQLDQREFEQKIRKTQSSGFLNAPEIPTRNSSLTSLDDKVISQTKKEAKKSSKLSIDTREVSVSLTNTDPQCAATLMKYALLMAHGKRVEAEETWLSETATFDGGIDRGASTRTIDNGSRKERRNGFAHRDTGACLTPPDSSRGLSRQQDTHERRGRERDKDPPSRYELASQDDDQSLQERGRRTRRSAAPSPSQSMLGYRHEEGNESALQPRRSRRDLLLELQSDQDSVLREYARVSLKDPSNHHRTRHHHTHDNAETGGHNHADSHSLLSPRNRLAPSTSISTSTPRRTPPALKPRTNHNTHEETDERLEPPVPSLYSTMSSLSSLSDFPHTSVEQAAHASVELASHIKEVEIRSKKSDASYAEETSSGEERERGRSRTGARRPLEVRGRVEESVEAGAQTSLEAFPPFDPTVREQPEREAPSLPASEQPGNSLSAFPVVPPTPTPAVSKSESFFTRGKNLRDKGKELSDRLAEVRGRQAQKPKVKKDIWELAMWKSGCDKKDGSK